MQGDLFGGNMLLARDLFDSLKAFRKDSGKGAMGYCEDTELSRRLRAVGEVVYFAPAALQGHVIGAERMTPSFVRKTSFEKGLSLGLLLEAALLGASYRALSDACKSSILAALSRLRSDEEAQMVAEVHTLYDLGRLFGYARQTRDRFRRRAPRTTSGAPDSNTAASQGNSGRGRVFRLQQIHGSVACDVRGAVASRPQASTSFPFVARRSTKC